MSTRAMWHLPPAILTRRALTGKLCAALKMVHTRYAYGAEDPSRVARDQGLLIFWLARDELAAPRWIQPLSCGGSDRRARFIYWSASSKMKRPLHGNLQLIL